MEKECELLDVACGSGFTVFASKSKGPHIYGSGNNKDGQIGYHAVRKGHPLETLVEPVRADLSLACSGAAAADDRVVKVSAGRAHTLALTSAGAVFALGHNGFGQCGRPIVADEDYFRSGIVHRLAAGDWLQALDEGDKIVDIHCAQDHSHLLSSAGRLLSFGWGADGQTGLGHYRNQESPDFVVGDVKGERVVKVSAAADCVLALNDCGDLFGWGNSEYGQFSRWTAEQQLAEPRRLNVDGVGKVIDVAAAASTCIVLNENHDVFVWGYGILGKGPALESTSTPSLIPAPLFGRNDFSADVHVTGVEAGLGAMAAINSNGELFAWGKNRSGCLGVGHWKDQFFPFKVLLAARVKKVSFGVDHSAAICQPWT